MDRGLRLLNGFVRLVWGADLDPPLRPVLAVGLVGSLAGSAGWTFVGIWAIQELGASSLALGAYFVASAIVFAIAGYVGGHLSDHVGRRPLVLVSYGGMAVTVLSYTLVGGRFWAAFPLLLVSGIFAALGLASVQALVADLVPPARHEAGYASVRVANNLGIVAGPVLGGLLLLGGHWPLLWIGVAACGFAAFAVALVYLPDRGLYSPDAPPERSSFAVIRRDHVFLLFVASMGLAFVVYVAFEAVLPIVAVTSYGLAPSTWGFLVVVNAALVTFFQLRITRAVSGYSATPRLAVAMLLMGFPFFVLEGWHSIPVVLAVIVVFVIGEMLWVPTSQAIAAGLAPADLRGAYMGAFAGAGPFGFAVGPFFALQIRSAFGNTAMWTFFALVAVAAAIMGAVAIRLAGPRFRE